jgi:hypothetical protein
VGSVIPLTADRTNKVPEARLSGSRPFASNRQSLLARLWIPKCGFTSVRIIRLRSSTRDPVTPGMLSEPLSSQSRPPLASHCNLILAGLGFEFLTKLLPQSIGYRT